MQKIKKNRIVRIFNKHFTIDGIKFDRPTGVGDAHMARLAEGDALTACPTCAQTSAIMFRKKMSRVMGQGLKELYRKTDSTSSDFIWIDDLVSGVNKNLGARIRGDISKMKFWGLIEKPDTPRYDGLQTKARRNGLYRITEKGIDFVEGRLYVPKFAAVYNDERLGLWGEAVCFEDVLKESFDWIESCMGASS